jgi:hypothetical protein
LALKPGETPMGLPTNSMKSIETRIAAIHHSTFADNAQVRGSAWTIR